MRPTIVRIGSTLTLDALASLAATDRGDEMRRRQFFLLTRERQVEAIRKLAESGMSDAAIGRACGLRAEQICKLMGGHS